MSRFIFGILVAAFALVVATGASAQGQMGLHDIQGVYIHIQDLENDLVADGLSRDALREDVDELVRITGLKVLSVEESMEARPGFGILRLVITANTLSEMNRIYAVRLDFRRKVQVLGQPNAQLMASTWQGLDIGMAPRKDMLEIRGTVRDLASKFTAEYRKANPKEPKVPAE